MFRFDPFSPEIDADPFPAYRRLRDEFPCFWSEEANAWILSRFADIVAALNDWPRYSSTKGNNVAELPNRAGGTLGTTDPPRHDQLRALIQYAFVKRNLDSLTGPIRDMAREAAEALRGRKRFDFVGDFCGDFTVKVLSAALGLPPGDEETVRQNAIMMAQTDPVIHAKGPQHVAAFEWMKAYAAKVIAERRAHPQNDLISHFARAEIDGDRLDRARAADDDDDADHGRRRIARRLHVDVRAQPRRLARRAPRGGRRSGAAARRDGGIVALQHLGAALPPLPDRGRRIARPADARRRLRLPRLWLGQSRRPAISQRRGLRPRAQAARPSRLRRLDARLPRLDDRPAGDRDRDGRSSTRSSPSTAASTTSCRGCPPPTFRSPLRLELEAA